ILGQTHPELFAAVGVHSGLPYGSAHDIPSALAAMKGGRGRAGNLAAAPPRATQAVRTIVFHGDRDHTVQASNGAEVARQAEAAHAARMGTAPAAPQAEQGRRAGRRYTRAVQADAAGRPYLEVWTVHGAGHAWSGGSHEGSFTDPAGPDASAEMVRFFLAP
ncbi:esterase, partial [Pelomonas sp. HMWF004]